MEVLLDDVNVTGPQRVPKLDAKLLNQKSKKLKKLRHREDFLRVLEKEDEVSVHGDGEVGGRATRCRAEPC